MMLAGIVGRCRWHNVDVWEDQGYLTLLKFRGGVKCCAARSGNLALRSFVSAGSYAEAHAFTT